MKDAAKDARQIIFGIYTDKSATKFRQSLDISLLFRYDVRLQTHYAICNVQMPLIFRR